MSAASLPLRRKILFATILTASLLALILGGTELTLRLAGYGHSPSFFRKVRLPDGQAMLRENRWCTAPFFSEKLVRRPQAFRLPEKKAAGTIRIFVLGSSAAMGDPDASFSLARMLEAMFRAAYPDKKFEVINAAITAINSHIVREIAGDCAKLEPDIFVVYEGHNEVIGPFGPAGVFTAFTSKPTLIRTAIRIKGTRTGQWLSSLGAKSLPEKWGGLEMFLAQQIRADDPRLESVRSHFRDNLLSIARAGANAGATTFICTVLTNQRDFAPFLSLHRAGLSDQDRIRWEEHFDSAEAAARAGDAIAAEAAYRAALAIDDQHAELLFRLGRLALQAGRDTEARALLQRALDLDALRFRTDSALNQIIRELPAEKSSGKLRIVDLATLITARSTHGVAGDDLLYEHVHLTFRGAYEAARELFRPIATELVARGSLPDGIPAPIGMDQARLRLAFTLHEQAMISLILEDRFRRAPFSTQSDRSARQETIRRRIVAATTALEHDDATASLRAVYDQALAASPDDWVLTRNAGMMLLSRKRPAEALPFLEKAIAWIDDDVDTLIALARAHRAMGHTDEAEKTLARARELEPSHPGLR